MKKIDNLNFILENTTSADVGGYISKQQTPLDRAIYDSFFSKIARVVNMNASQELVYMLTHSYNMNGVTGSQILITETEIPNNIKDITSGTKKAKILFKDQNKILISSNSEFVVNDALSAGGKVTSAANNILGQRPSLLNFGKNTVVNNEKNISAGLDYKIKGVLLQANKSRKLKVSASQEFLQDMQSLYNDENSAKILEKISNYTLAEIFYSLDCEVIKFLFDKSIQENKKVINLSEWYEQGFYDISQTLGSKIIQSAESISFKTIKPPAIFVIATPNIVKHIISHPNFIPADEKDNVYYRGELFGYKVFSDITGSITKDYMIIGAHNEGDLSINSVIVGVYNKVHLQQTYNPENGNAELFTSLQYDIKGNPLDLEGEGRSVFLRKWVINDDILTGETMYNNLKETELTIDKNILDLKQFDVGYINIKTNGYLSYKNNPKLTEVNLNKGIIKGIGVGTDKIVITAKESESRAKSLEITVNITANESTTLDVKETEINLEV